ncbi:hypothetical protein ACFSMW_00870 [Virgibacillus halophilus]|uniref:Uncharacterized protein n=1 Tax=Tigheibacillus halophilus TaxID=361280 RepID=A0ABU5C950_9BACI|nr:hypothetical protein [Virgibacillus halophilus]
MSVELLTEFINDVSPFYFYLSILLSAVSVLHIANVHLHRFVNDQGFYAQGQAPKIQLPPIPEPIGEITGIRNWITLKVKRTEAPEDDTDSDPIRKNTAYLFILRGGLRWKINLYSLSLKNMA